MPRRRDVAAEELTNLLDDVKSLATTLANDPKEQARKQRLWQLLYGGLSAATALVARRFAIKTWGILTGEVPPAKSKPRKA